MKNFQDFAQFQLPMENVAQAEGGTCGRRSSYRSYDCYSYKSYSSCNNYQQKSYYDCNSYNNCGSSWSCEQPVVEYKEPTPEPAPPVIGLS